MIRRIRSTLRPNRLFLNASLLLICFLTLLPIVWVVSSSLKPKEELYVDIPTLIPRHPTLANYRAMIGRTGGSSLPLNLFNSVKVVGAAVLLTCFLSTLAGFAFARLEFRGRDLLFYAFVGLMFVPRAGGLMAVYELLEFLHLRNTHLGLIFWFTAGLSQPIFIMRQTLLALPSELEDAAVLDGASTPQLLWHLAIPFARSGVVVVAVWKFIRAWGDYLFTYTMIDEPKLMTVSVAIQQIVGMTITFTEGPFTTYGGEAAAQVLATLPVLIIFILLQRWFVRGLTEGVLKM